MDYKELILDMMNRIIVLEKEVSELKGREKEKPAEEILPAECDCFDKPQQRDKTRYMFKGNIYLKNRLVLAVVKDYVLNNPTVSCGELKEVFDKSLQGSIGVVEYESTAKYRGDYQVRFFAKDNEVIKLKDGNMLVCSQWGILNIPNFIKRAGQLGYTIEKMKKN